MTGLRTLSLLALCLSLLVSSPASALLGGGRHDGPGGSFAGPRGGGLLRQLVFPCRSACSEELEACVETADATAAECVLAACPDEVAAAQSDCADEAAAEACIEDLEALRLCADSCLDARAAAIGECRAAQIGCREACESEE